MVFFGSDRLSLSGAVYSEQGGRPDNQDDFGFAETPLGFVVVVCDGMGGGPGGRTASSAAKNVIIQTLMSANSMSDPQQFISLAIGKAQEELHRLISLDFNLKGMGTTVAMVLFTPEAAYVAHLGDSRIYRLHNKTMVYRSQDHSLVGEMVQRKTITEEQARLSPQSNIITRGLGSMSNNTVEIDVVPYKKGDRFYICTDGVWGTMPQPQLLALFARVLPCDQLLKEISIYVDRNGRTKSNHFDNHTLAIVQLANDSTLKDKLDMQTKIVLIALSVLLFLSIILNIILGVKINSLNKQLQQPAASYGILTTPPSNIDGLEEQPIDTVNPAKIVSGETPMMKAARERAEKAKQDSIEAAKEKERGKSGNGKQKMVKDSIEVLITICDRMLKCQNENENGAVNYLESQRDLLITNLEEMASSSHSSMKSKAEGVLYYINNKRCEDKKKTLVKDVVIKVQKKKGKYVPTDLSIKYITEIKKQITDFRSK